MLDRLREHWLALSRSAPGRRFEDRYHRKRAAQGQISPVHAYLRMGAGAAITVLGVVMLFTPGPGSLALAVGLSLIGSGSLRTARLLDRCELKLRPMFSALRRWLDKWLD